MAVYVDQERNKLGRMVMCHMFADTLAELHDMAQKIGMRRDWFQPLSFPHYDVSLSRKADALRHGAIEVDRRKGYALRRQIKASWTIADILELREAIPHHDERKRKGINH